MGRWEVQHRVSLAEQPRTGKSLCWHSSSLMKEYKTGKRGEGNTCLWGHKYLLAFLVLAAYSIIRGTRPWGEALWARPGSGTVLCVGNFPVVVRWKGGIEFREI